MPLDPVCRSTLKTEDVNKTEIYKGKAYYFCCPSCHDKFLQNPKNYIGRTWWQRFLHRLAESNAEEFEGKGPSCHG